MIFCVWWLATPLYNCTEEFAIFSQCSTSLPTWQVSSLFILLHLYRKLKQILATCCQHGARVGFNFLWIYGRSNKLETHQVLLALFCLKNCFFFWSCSELLQLKLVARHLRQSLLFLHCLPLFGPFWHFWAVLAVFLLFGTFLHFLELFVTFLHFFCILRVIGLRKKTFGKNNSGRTHYIFFHFQTDIAVSTLNWPRGWFSENGNWGWA